MTELIETRAHDDPKDALAWSVEIHERNMELAIGVAHASVNRGGAAIGAVIVDRRGRLIAEGHSMVAPLCDPTAHAETGAIRMAALRVGRFHLPDLVLYSTLEPCSMCLAACVWANLGAVIFGADGTVTSGDYYDRRNYCAVSHARETRRDASQTPLPIRGRVLLEETAALLGAG
ncbi:MAG: nucleoside deaminase [Solirubrobacterales bacterium]